MARRRRRPPLPARRPLHRDDRPLQRADRPVDDRARRGARPALARPRRAAVASTVQKLLKTQGITPDVASARARAARVPRAALVDEPDEVEVEEFEEDDGTLVLELSVAEDDYGTGHRPRRTHRAGAAHRRQGRGGQGQPARPRRHRRVSSLRGRPRRPAARARRLVPRDAARRAAARRARRCCVAGAPARRSCAARAPTSSRSCGSRAAPAREARRGAARRAAAVPRRRRRCSRRTSTGRTTSRAAPSSTATREVGVVRADDRAAVVRGARGRARGRRELLVPLVRDAIRSIDVEARRIDIDLGFVEREARRLHAVPGVVRLVPRRSATSRTRSALGHALERVDSARTTPLNGGQVDDTPFGGGAGMVLRVDVDRGGAARPLRRRSGRRCASAARDRADARAAGCSTTRSPTSWRPSRR